MYLFGTCCCFKPARLPQVSSTQLLPVEAHRAPEARQVPPACHICAPPRLKTAPALIHGCYSAFFYFIFDPHPHPHRPLSPGAGFLQEEPAEGGETLELWLRNEYFVEFCLLSQSLVGLPCYVVAMEKNIGSCAIKKKKSSRKRHFQEFFLSISFFFFWD